jgi:hypothetical protein
MTTTRDLTARVLRLGAATVAVLSAAAWWVGGAPLAGGVLGGGFLALVNFGWLHREVAAVAERMATGQSAGVALKRLGLRQVAVLGGLGLLIGLGWGHPVGVAVGLAAVPPIFLIEGLRSARAAA